MQPVVIHIPIAHLDVPAAQPLTRECVIDFAHRAVGAACEVCIVLTADDEDGLDIELATIELNSAHDGGWRLQYVSHPAQSCGLTAAIAPCMSDFVAFIQARKTMRLPDTLSPVCAQELEDEGLGPLAVLNLRLQSPVPVVPEKANLGQLATLARIASTN